MHQSRPESYRPSLKTSFGVLSYILSSFFKLPFVCSAVSIGSIIFPLLAFPVISVASVQKIVIHWVSETTSGHVDLLKDFNGNPLSAGISGNGDGCLVSLGYFKGATSEEPFKGTWKPLTFGTRIGDSSSGYGFEDGMFAFTTQFSKDSDKVLVYPYRPASYVVTSSVPVTVETPPAGTPICIRFYDGTALGLTARYNTVTGPGWKWPAFSSGIPQNLYLKAVSYTHLTLPTKA